MPELPEVETIVRDLARRVADRPIQRTRLHHPDVLRGTSRARVTRRLTGSRIRRLSRRAKHLVLSLSGGYRLVVQPGMTGSLLLLARRPAGTARRYAVLELTLDHGEVLLYRDVRRLGRIHLLDEDAWAAYTARIGPEPLAPRFDEARFATQMQGTRQAIKKTLMDQRRLAGVGNIYATEALYLARIDPSRPTDGLTERELAALFRSIRDVLRGAVRRRGTTVRDYRTGTGERGAYQSALRAYGRAGEPCDRCGTRLAITHAIDQRATTFCWRCQR